jgi:hypothetical protein
MVLERTDTKVKLETYAFDRSVFIFTVWPFYLQVKSLSTHRIRVPVGSEDNLDTVMAKTRNPV